MPQLDFNIAFSNFIFLIFFFIISYIFFTFFFLPRILKIVFVESFFLSYLKNRQKLSFITLQKKIKNLKIKTTYLLNLISTNNIIN